MFPRTEDQLLFEETTKRFLETECPPARVRELAHNPLGYERSFWKKGAELGWTSLGVPEEAGGGSVSEQGVKDLSLVAYQFGLHAAPGPLCGSNIVAAALGRWGSEEQKAGPLAELMSGDAIGAWALAEAPPNDNLGQIEVLATEIPGGFRLEGSKTPVDAGAEASHILVTARHGQGLSQFLLPTDASGLTTRPLTALDMTKRFARLDFDGVPVPGASLVGEAGTSAAAVDWLADLAVAMQLAEMCGAMRWAFDTTVEWAMNRYSFGRPLASYQEIKHRFADMKMWLEASTAIAAQAADAVDRDTASRAETVSAGKYYVGRFGVELMQDCVQMHGGIGVTFDHDLHLFLRRVVTNVPLFGTPSQHAVRLTDILEAREASQ
jgi:alkylation response protein AidB-like acyl-CoA dehydrogenase